MNRIHQLFKNKPNGILSIYFTAGFPKLFDTVGIIKNLEESGVDMIEIGFPFSDPLADGPVIQQSSAIALENGMTLSVLFNQLKDIRKHVRLPLILMGYMNPVLQYGEKAFFEKCRETGIDGVILPDMSLDYLEKNLKTTITNNEVANILLIAPGTSDDRIQYIDSLSNGFVYTVSSNSITGGSASMDLHIDYFNRIKSLDLKNPTLIGFGIKNKVSFDDACRNSHGAIIGTAFIEHLKLHGSSKNSIQKFIKNIRS